jgi:predicted glycosyl hydrolase (DUF1957 family)
MEENPCECPNSNMNIRKDEWAGMHLEEMWHHYQRSEERKFKLFQKHTEENNISESAVGSCIACRT